MRVHIHLRYVSLERALRFYVEELGHFQVAQDLGMGDVLLRSVHNAGICLMLREGDAASGEQHPVFSLSVENVPAEFARLKALELEEGVGVVGDAPFDCPIGRNFTVRDPSGNWFTLDEWWYGED